MTLEEAHRRYGPPALGGALVDARGAVDVTVVGTRVRGGDEPALPGDLWHIGSCAKAMTSSCYARLVERGAADWGATVPELLPDLADSAETGWHRITIVDLLTHRAGLPGNLSRRELPSLARDPRPVEELRTAVAAGVLARPPRRPGGFRYSNVGYILAGAAIERIVGQSWEDAIAELLFTPLGISSAGFGAPVGRQPRGHASRSRGFGCGPPVDPGEAGRPAPEADNPAIMGPAGRVHMALADWARFVAQFLEGGATVLRPESVARILTAPARRGPAQAMGWAYPGRRGRRAGVGFGQQGSNRLWVATAIVAPDRRHAALVTANDGRARLLRTTAELALALLPTNRAGRVT